MKIGNESILFFSLKILFGSSLSFMGKRGIYTIVIVFNYYLECVTNLVID